MATSEMDYMNIGGGIILTIPYKTGSSDITINAQSRANVQLIQDSSDSLTGCVSIGVLRAVAITTGGEPIAIRGFHYDDTDNMLYLSVSNTSNSAITMPKNTQMGIVTFLKN